MQLTALLGDTVRASAALSFDADGDSLSYAWSVDARPVGSVATVDAADTAAASFVPDPAGIYVLAVRVSDGGSASFAYVTVRVMAQFESSVTLDFVPRISGTAGGWTGSWWPLPRPTPCARSIRSPEPSRRRSCPRPSRTSA
ncbi:hypothetical protein HK414_09190 [Ramlibacter terrae]|uniref:PKD domain-containing protein n=1 Tax=Ramlibacter terrae TaxID=2732511 RepID=A0ABX6P3D8_9BURK|nr:hypothetical protein HK414_09190 [Ramlibacter terrae]